ncbi:hypothetical protein ACIGW8_36200 [Streptomyces sioyaensis]|uniref:hypothetical protein n=1 Tax=Streptomyces sioyaensis TaxID=67364 RepID=UPI0037D240ED
MTLMLMGWLWPGSTGTWCITIQSAGREGDAFGLLDRFRAAVPLVAWVMVGAIEFLNYIRALKEAGLLQFRQEVFGEQVAFKSTVWEEPAEMYYAPVGAEAPSLASSPMPEGAPAEQDNRPVDLPPPLRGTTSACGAFTVHDAAPLT